MQIDINGIIYVPCLFGGSFGGISTDDKIKFIENAKVFDITFKWLYIYHDLDYYDSPAIRTFSISQDKNVRYINGDFVISTDESFMYQLQQIQLYVATLDTESLIKKLKKEAYKNLIFEYNKKINHAKKRISELNKKI